MCPEAQTWEELARHQLPADAEREARRHLDGCATCRGEYEEVAANLAIVESVGRAAAKQGASGSAASAFPEVPGFEIIAELGRGGMGVVYEARQMRPRRIVALKVLDVGRISPEALRRFDREAEALARLAHPFIAQIFASGTIEQPGRSLPYFVMERVDGAPLADYLRASNPSLRERIALLADLCDGVQHAHDRGVIHRDLKPSNILIVDRSGADGSSTSRDHSSDGTTIRSGTSSRVGRAAAPKILDFGVARVTDVDIQATTLHTSAGQLIGTVPFMSPEQASGDPGAIGTASDIYALGVIGYKMLTGRLPHDLESLVVHEAVRVIREDDPTPLSRVDRSLRGDIETIVSKALEKDPARRYASAEQMGDDLRRYLSNEAILARPATRAYRLQKFVRRHRALVSAVAVVFLVLLGGTGVSTWQAIRASRSERVARDREQTAHREAAKAGAIRDFLQEMLASPDPTVSPGKSDLTVRDVLAQAVAKLDAGSLGDQPEVEAAVRTTIGNTYRSLGDHASAEPQLKTAVEIGRLCAPEGSEDLAYALNKLGRTQQSVGNLKEAEASFREALAMRRRLLGDDHPDVTTILNNLGWLLCELGQLDESEAMLSDALARRRTTFGERHSDVATSMNNLAIVYTRLAQPERAAEMLRASLDIDRELRGEHPNVAATMCNLALVEDRLGRSDEAEALLIDALEMRRRVFDGDHPDLAVTIHNLAAHYDRHGDPTRAESLYREAVEMYRRTSTAAPAIAGPLMNLSQLLARTGRLDEAIPVMEETLSIHSEAAGPVHARTIECLAQLGTMEIRRERYDKAAARFNRALEAARRTYPDDHPIIGCLLVDYGRCMVKMARHDEAATVLKEARQRLADRGDSVSRFMTVLEALEAELAETPSSE